MLAASLHWPFRVFLIKIQQRSRVEAGEYRTLPCWDLPSDRLGQLVEKLPVHGVVQGLLSRYSSNMTPARRACNMCQIAQV